MAAVAIDATGHRILVSAHDFAQVLGVEMPRQGSGADKVAEHHRQLAALGFYTGGALRGGVRSWRRLGRGLQLRDRREELAARAQRNADLLEVIFGNMGQRIEIDLVLGEQIHVSAEAQMVQPRGDVLRHSRLAQTYPE